ncbi:MAG: hypothetical protein HUU06_07580, partial [Planctomycetaceae bacterium]|nr:hypothetical protein [Planctomycetaceae bacterium]
MLDLEARSRGEAADLPVAALGEGQEEPGGLRALGLDLDGEGAGYVALRDGSLFPGDRVITKGSHELSTFFVPGVLRISPEAAANMRLQIEPIRPRVVERILEFDGAIDVPPAGRASV